VKAPMRVRTAAFGILVAEVQCPSTPHVHLPVDRPNSQTVEEAMLASGMPPELIRSLMAPAERARAVDEAALAGDELRAHLEREADRTAQPFGWGQMTYQSISGTRWRCCQRLFEDGHSPYCPAGRFADPLPPA
jgi:hypothetical protein